MHACLAAVAVRAGAAHVEAVLLVHRLEEAVQRHELLLPAPHHVHHLRHALAHLQKEEGRARGVIELLGKKKCAFAYPSTEGRNIWPSQLFGQSMSSAQRKLWSSIFLL